MNQEEGTTKVTVIDQLIDKIRDLNDRIDDLEGVVYGCDCDDEDEDLCPDCRFDVLLDSLGDLDDDQLQVVRSEANRLLEERSQEGVIESITTKGSRS